MIVLGVESLINWLIIRFKKGSSGLSDVLGGGGGEEGRLTGLSRRSSGNSVFGTSEGLDRDFVMIDLKTPFAQQSSFK